eukprot:606352-Pelagomonas_calceolata.AAC.4
MNPKFCVLAWPTTVRSCLTGLSEYAGCMALVGSVTLLTLGSVTPQTAVCLLSDSNCRASA